MKQIELQQKGTGRHSRFALGNLRFPAMGSPTSITPPSIEPALKNIERDLAAKGPIPTTALSQGRGLQLSQKPKTTELFEAVREEAGISLAMSSGLSMSTSATAAAALTATMSKDSVQLLLEERIVLIATKDGGLQNMEVKGDLTMRTGDMDKSRIRVFTHAKEEHGVQIKTHPNVDRKSFSTNGLIISKDPQKPFPINQPVNLLRWRMQTTNASEIPLSINCWPSPSGDGSCDVNLEYVLENETLELKDVEISIPVP
jgi:hypothetical protein